MRRIANERRLFECSRLHGITKPLTKKKVMMPACPKSTHSYR